MQMWILIIFFGFNLMLLSNSFAQETKTLAAPVRVYTRNKADTLKALERLYYRIHRNNNIAMIVSGIGIIGVISVNAKDEYQNNNLAVVTVGLVGINLVSGINSYRFNKKWYGQAIENYKAGKSLPRRIFYRLKEKDFE